MANIISAIKNSTKKSYSHVTGSSTGGWWPLVREPFAGAWQQNIEWRRETVLAYHAIFACITLIASDISKLRVKLVKEAGGIWTEIPYGNYKVLDTPNTYQNHIQFFERWIISKLTRGNTYVLKGRDRNGKVTKLYVLHPDMVCPLVSGDGQVFYQLSQDNLSGITETGVTVPASEIIHDRFNCLFHDLVGLSPIFACGLAAYNALKMQENSTKLYLNGARPSGILTAPGAITNDTAARLKSHWESNYGGDNYGKVAVLGDDLKYEPLTVTAEEGQMVEQLRLNAEIVCSTFHVPKYKVISDAPSYNNIEALEQQYYSQCLQVLIESIELLLDDGLEIPDGTGAEFDLDGLLRMDSKTQIETLKAGVGSSIYSPNEARKKMNLAPAKGGDSPLSQQQNFSLEALAKRDAKADPFAKEASAPVTTPPTQERALLEMIQKEFSNGLR